MNILFVEDSESAAKFKTVLEIKMGHRVEWINNVADAEEYLLHSSDRQYDAVILDLDVSNRYLPRRLREEARTKDIFAGWLFYKYILPDKWKQKTIIFSGFLHLLSEKIEKEEYDELMIVDKNDADREATLGKYLTKIQKGGKGS